MFRRPMALLSLTSLVLVGCAGGASAPPAAHAAPAAPVAAPPRGVDARVWRDVAWLPAGLTSIAEFQHAHDFAPVLDWLRDLEFAKSLSCIPAVKDKVDRYLMIEGPAGKAEVFFGSARLDEVRGCAQQFLAELGGHAELDGELVALRVDDKPGVAYLGAARHGNETMIVESSDAELVHLLVARPGGLAHDDALVHLLEGLDLSGDAWMVGLIDYGSKALGIESTGYQSSVFISGVKRSHVDARGELRLHFASADKASDAEAAGRAIFDQKVPEPDHGVIARAMEVSTTGSVLRIRLHASEADFMPTFQALMNVAARVTGADPIDLSTPTPKQP
jgi:hypothetical protein